jgi:photosystem II stability/assembly factor-like uncharacterized protein
VKNIVLLFVLIIITISNNTKAQWVQADGPYGGVVNCVAAHGNVLFAGTNSGLYRSLDNGNGWNRIPIDTNSAQSILSIYDIQIVDSAIFIATSYGMRKSYDGGSTWNFISPFNGFSIKKILIKDNYLVGVENYDNYAYLGVCELDSSMSDINRVLGYLNMNISQAPSAPAIVINSFVFDVDFIVAGTSYGIYVSFDTGKTWGKSYPSLTDTTIEAVALYGNKLFAGTYSSGIFCSTDSGKTWRECNTGLTTHSIKTISVNGNKIYAGTNGSGVFVSSDSGTSWSPMNQGLTNSVINTIRFNGDVPIAGTDGNGVYKYDGESWMSINSGLLATYINTFTSIGSSLFAATDGGGVYRSSDDGTNWTAVNTGMTSLNVNALAVKGNNLFAGTLKGGMFLSGDNGASWKSVNNGITSKHIYALTVSGNNIFAGSGMYGIPYSFSYANPLGWADSGFVFRSSDNGNSWVVVDTGLFSVYALASIDTNVFFSNITGIRLSTDEGENWKDVSLHYTYYTHEYTTIVPAFAVKGEKLFAGTISHGISMYNVQDTSWETINNSGLFYIDGHQQPIGKFSISAITSNDTALFAAVKSSTIGWLYMSTDEGNSWKEIVIPFENSPVMGLYFLSYITSLTVHNNYLYAGTSGFGVWKVPLSGIVTGVKDITNETPSKYTLEQNYPNPFNPTTIIKYEMPESGFVSLKIYDILGREVQTLVNGNKIRGTYEVSFNGSSLASGVYLYKLKAGNYTSTKKMMLIK